MPRYKSSHHAHHHLRLQRVIYRSGWHLALTFLLIAVPFIFLLVFANITKIGERALFSDLFMSLLRMFVAYVISVVLAWTCAVIFYPQKIASIMLPVFDVLQSFPIFAALPIAVSVWGTSNAIIIFFLVLNIVWPIFFTMVSSFKLMRRDWEEVVEMSGLSMAQRLEHFLIPVSIPGIITGSIVGLGSGWSALVATEIIAGTHVGLGTFFQAFSNDTAITSFAILGLLLIIFSLNKLVWLPLLEWSHQAMSE